MKNPYEFENPLDRFVENCLWAIAELESFSHNPIRYSKITIQGYDRKIDKSMDIIDALLLYYNFTDSVPQLVPLCKAIKFKRMTRATTNILEWVITQFQYRKALAEDRLPEMHEHCLHIGYSEWVWLHFSTMNEPVVPDDVRLINSAFQHSDNYFVITENDFQFAPHISVAEQDKLARKVMREWQRRSMLPVYPYHYYKNQD